MKIDGREQQVQRLRLDVVKDRRKDWNPAGAGEEAESSSVSPSWAPPLVLWAPPVHPVISSLVHGLHRGATLHAIPGLQYSHPGHQVSLPDGCGSRDGVRGPGSWFHWLCP